MSYRIKKLRLEETEAIYRAYIGKHFPQDEIKPFKHIRRMWQEGSYQALGLYEITDLCPEKLAGYAFFALGDHADMLLLDYYAILEEYRCQGLGGKFLLDMQESFQDYEGMLIETEDVDYAQSEKQRQERLKRDRFYMQNGATKTGVSCEVYGVHYCIWKLPFRDHHCSSEQCRRNLRNIYKTMVLGEKFEKYVRIR